MYVKKRGKIFLLILLIVVVNTLTACSSSQESSEKILRIGVVGPESGGSAQLGQGQRKAVELAVNEINKNKLAGEWKLEAVFINFINC